MKVCIKTGSTGNLASILRPGNLATTVKWSIRNKLDAYLRKFEFISAFLTPLHPYRKDFRIDKDTFVNADNLQLIPLQIILKSCLYSTRLNEQDD